MCCLFFKLELAIGKTHHLIIRHFNIKHFITILTLKSLGILPSIYSFFNLLFLLNMHTWFNLVNIACNCPGYTSKPELSITYILFCYILQVSINIVQFLDIISDSAEKELDWSTFAHYLNVSLPNAVFFFSPFVKVFISILSWFMRFLTAIVSQYILFLMQKNLQKSFYLGCMLLYWMSMFYTKLLLCIFCYLCLFNFSFSNTDAFMCTSTVGLNEEYCHDGRLITFRIDVSFS